MPFAPLFAPYPLVKFVYLLKPWLLILSEWLMTQRLIFLLTECWSHFGDERRRRRRKEGVKKKRALPLPLVALLLWSEVLWDTRPFSGQETCSGLLRDSVEKIQTSRVICEILPATAWTAATTSVVVIVVVFNTMLLFHSFSQGLRGFSPPTLHTPLQHRCFVDSQWKTRINEGEVGGAIWFAFGTGPSCDWHWLFDPRPGTTTSHPPWSREVGRG